MSIFFITHLDPHTRQPRCVCWSPAVEDAPPGLPPARNLLPFLFPDAPPIDWLPREYLAPTSHCFTLTGSDGGTRLHGFCRTCLPPPPPAAGRLGPRHRLPWVLCVLSPHLWPAFFFKALELIDKLLQAEPHSVHACLPATLPHSSAAAGVLRQLAAAAGPRPIPGAIISLNWSPSLIVDLAPVRTAATDDVLRAGSGILELEVPNVAQTPAGGVPLARLFAYVTPRQAVSVLAALLLERRLVFSSADPGRACLAVHAAAALLHPFAWHHIYLPLLPRGLDDYLHAPVPLLAGAAAATVAAGGPEALQGALVVDLDLPGTCSPAVGSLEDDALLLPRSEALAGALATAAAGLRGPEDPTPTPQIFHALHEWYNDVILGGLEGFIEDASSSAVATADAAFIEHGLALDWSSFIEIQRLREDGEARVLFLESFRHSQMLEVAVRAALRRRAEGARDAPDAVFEPMNVRLEVREIRPVAEAPQLIDLGAASPPQQRDARSPLVTSLPPAEVAPSIAFPSWTTFGDAEGTRISPPHPQSRRAAAVAAPPPAAQEIQGPLQQGLPLLAAPVHSVLPMSPLRQGAAGAVTARVGGARAGAIGNAIGDGRRVPDIAMAVQIDGNIGHTANPVVAAAAPTPGAGRLQDPFAGLVLEAVAGMVGPRLMNRSAFLIATLALAIGVASGMEMIQNEPGVHMRRLHQSSIIDTAKDKAADVGNAIGDAASAAADKVKELGQSAVDAAKNLVGAGKNKTQDAAGTVANATANAGSTAASAASNATQAVGDAAKDAVNTVTGAGSTTTVAAAAVATVLAAALF